ENAVFIGCAAGEPSAVHLVDIGNKGVPLRVAGFMESTNFFDQRNHLRDIVGGSGADGHDGGVGLGFGSSRRSQTRALRYSAKSCSTSSSAAASGRVADMTVLVLWQWARIRNVGINWRAMSVVSMAAWSLGIAMISSRARSIPARSRI